MAYTMVFEWMDEFESLTESEIHTYAAEQEHNHEVILALYNILAEPHKYKSDNLIDGICQQLLNFYRSGEPELRKFTVQYIPSLVFLHLSDKSFTAVQTLLVSLYNLEVVDSKGQPLTLSFRIPSIAQSSIYHDSHTLEPTFIAESSLRRWEECNTKLVSWGPLPQVESLNAQNRQRVVTALMFLYNQQLANVLIQGIEYTCRSISRLVTQGFNLNSDSTRSSIASDSSYQLPISILPRVQVSGPLLIELLHIVYHGAERCANGAIQALHDIIQRATYETYSDVLLAASAVKNLLQNSPSVSITSRPSHVHSVSKSMITNASFRTKKLPDDIPIQNEQQQSDVPLDSITEEQEEGDKSKNKTVLKHLPKLPGLTKKHKEKVKNNLQGDQNVEMTSTVDAVDSSCNDNNYNAVHVSAV
ncbi:hyccin [Sitophilus oryzae]|uniref:Hyccin n=1 Tax=Sitophilus oryzae TaxID=7048 RepID=A0A6J2YJ67_SITOR|nr:hyccin [Sitophilus oryzae]